MKTKSLAIFLIAGLFTFNLYAQFAGGSGTPEDPYRVATLMQLQAISNLENLDKHFIQVADIDASETASWNDGQGFIPIGNSQYYPFRGSYDGSGFNISNLFIVSEMERVGLFSRWAGGGIISNLNLKNALISGNSSSYTGGIIGHMASGGIYNSKVENCEIYGGPLAGGLVGVIYGSIINSSVVGGQISSNFITGGLAATAEMGIIENSFANTNIEGARAGGLLGIAYNNYNIKNSYAHGLVSGNEMAGGLVGETWYGINITNSYSICTVAGIQNTGGLTGGIYGDDLPVFEGCYWDMESSNQTNAVGFIAGSLNGAIGLSTVQMTGLGAYNNMTGFEFGTTWKLTEGYPALFWEDVNEVFPFEPDNPVLITPLNGIENQPATIQFSWEKSIFSQYFNLQISSTSTFSNVLLNIQGIDTTAYLISDLDFSTQYFWRVNAYNSVGTSPWSEIWSFSTLEPPDPPSLASPSNGSVNLPIDPELSWGLVDYADSYGIQVSALEDFSEIQFETQNFEGTTMSVSGLDYSTQYYWRVNASNDAGTGPWSEVWSFTTLVPPDAPLLVSPSNSSLNLPIDPELSWGLVDYADSYGIQVSAQADFSEIQFETQNIEGTTVVVSGLDYSTQYYWRVNASNEAGTSSWSEPWNFTTLVPPAAPSLVSPSSGSTDHPVSLELSWSLAGFADSYGIQVSALEDFSEIQYETQDIEGNTLAVAGLDYSTQYYWRVNASNEAGNSPWSEVWSFVTLMPPDPPALMTPINGAEHLPIAVELAWTPMGVLYNELIAYWDQNNNFLPNEEIGFLADPDVFPQEASQGDGLITIGGGIINETEFKNGFLVYRWLQSYLGTTINAQPGIEAGRSISIVNGTEASNNGAYLQFQLDFSLFENVLVSYASRGTSLGFSNQIWSWSIDGINFIDFQSIEEIQSTYDLIEFNCPKELNTQGSVFLRVTFYGALNESGNNRLDNIKFTGDIYPNNLYRVQVSLDSNFTSIIQNVSGIQNVSIQISELSFESTYFWRVNATNEAGEGPWSEVWSFTTLAPPPSPSLASPSSGSVNLPIDPELSWGLVDYADTYGIQVSVQEDFFVIQFEAQNIEGTSAAVSGLDYSTQYYWRVNASNEAGTGPWSEVWSFETLDYFELVVLSGASYCQGDFMNLGVNLNAPFEEGNVFTVELSDIDGSFETPIVLEEIQTNLPFDAEVNVPDTLSLEVTYYVRVRSSSPEAYSEAFPVTFYGYPGADFIFSTDALCWGEMVEIVYTNSVSEVTTFTWDFDGGSVISGEGAGPYLVSWPTAGYKNIFLSVEANGCVTQNTGGLFVAPQTQPNPICMVTVNEENKNMILFEQPELNPYESIVIYKEGSQAGVYSLIGHQLANGPGFFVDENSNPAQNSNRYRIAVVDTCGYETPLSDFHKTMHLTISAGINGAWNLIWDKYEGFNYSTFFIYRGTSEGQLNLIAELPSNLFTFSDQAPPAGTVFYQIEVVNPNPCDVNFEKSGKQVVTSSRSNLVNSQQTTSVGEYGYDRLVVWPNPTKGVLYIQGDFAPGKREVELVSISGKVMKRVVLLNDENEVDLSGLPEGVYIFRMLSGSEIYYKRIIKL